MRFKGFAHEVRASLALSGADLLLLQTLARRDRSEELARFPWQTFGTAWMHAWWAGRGCPDQNLADALAADPYREVQVTASQGELARCLELLTCTLSSEARDLREDLQVAAHWARKEQDRLQAVEAPPPPHPDAIKHTATLLASGDLAKIEEARRGFITFLHGDERRVSSIMQTHSAEDYPRADPQLVYSFVVGPTGLDSHGPLVAILLGSLHDLAVRMGVTCTQVDFKLP